MFGFYVKDNMADSAERAEKKQDFRNRAKCEAMALLLRPGLETRLQQAGSNYE